MATPRNPRDAYKQPRTPSHHDRLTVRSQSGWGPEGRGHRDRGRDRILSPIIMTNGGLEPAASPRALGSDQIIE
eukprot:646306-Hanusia_phi.AAC.1